MLLQAERVRVAAVNTVNILFIVKCIILGCEYTKIYEAIQKKPMLHSVGFMCCVLKNILVIK